MRVMPAKDSFGVNATNTIYQDIISKKLFYLYFATLRMRHE